KCFKPIKNIFFRPDNSVEIITKNINYFNFNIKISCPLQILYKAEEYGIEPSLSRLIMNELSKGDECIDIGANYGFITMIMAKAVGIDGNVYSYESDPMIYPILLNNINDNNINNICSTENYFISNNKMNNKKTVDDLLLIKSKSIKLIKIDTDGSDYNCLLGAEKLIHRDMPIIIIEMNENAQKIYRKLCSLGYEYYYDQYYNSINLEEFPINLIASFQPLTTL
ncbi:uncharacterized protein METZ01_LOCUS495839, partial [marine metagenome]